MKFDLIKKNKNEVEIKFESTKEEYEEASRLAYEHNKYKYEFDGFRKGNVPKRVIEKNLGDMVFFEDAFTHLADTAYSIALNQNKDIHPYAEPGLEYESFVEGVVKGKISLKVLPLPTLGKYKGLEVKVKQQKLSKEMVEAELKHAQSHHTHSHPAPNKVAENGDIVVIDFVGSMDGVEFEGGKAKDYELELGSHSFIDTFEDQLVGHKEGDHVTVNVTFPSDYGAKALAGKKAVFECDVKSVNTKHIPEIDDELAKHVAGVNTLAEWKKEIEAQLKHEIEAANSNAYEEAIINEIIKTSKIELPDEYVNAQLDIIMRDLAQRLAYQGMRLEDYANYLGTTVDKLREERKPDAIHIAQSKQVFEAVIAAEKITVSEKEIDAELESFAKAAKKSLKEYKNTMDEKRYDYLYSDILMRKLIKFLKDNNKLIPVDEDDAPAKKAPAKAKAKAEEKPAKAEPKATKATAKKTTKTEAKPANKATAKKTTK